MSDIEGLPQVKHSPDMIIAQAEVDNPIEVKLSMTEVEYEDVVRDLVKSLYQVTSDQVIWGEAEGIAPSPRHLEKQVTPAREAVRQIVTQIGLVESFPPEIFVDAGIPDVLSEEDRTRIDQDGTEEQKAKLHFNYSSGQENTPKSSSQVEHEHKRDEPIECDLSMTKDQFGAVTYRLVRSLEDDTRNQFYGAYDRLPVYVNHVIEPKRKAVRQIVTQSGIQNMFSPEYFVLSGVPDVLSETQKNEIRETNLGDNVAMLERFDNTNSQAVNPPPPSTE